MRFAALTPASANPLLFGLYGADISCTISLVSQNPRKSPKNWGPPSDLIDLGHPKVLNHDVNIFTTAALEVVVNLLIIM
jgi:hypothetical protein